MPHQNIFQSVFNLYPAEKIKMNAEIDQMKVFKTDTKSHQQSNGNFLYNETGETISGDLGDILNIDSTCM
jgi:hypothetical protein